MTKLSSKDGIYLLSNDVVIDQVIALINSIKANYSNDISICIIPYNDEIEKLRTIIPQFENVFIFEDQKSIQKWDHFIRDIHQIFLAYPFQDKPKRRIETPTMHRKYCAFDGLFERFIYIDTDTLVMKPLDHVFKALDTYDFVVHDFQRETDRQKKTVQSFFNALKADYSSEEDLYLRFHCGGFWASHRKLFTEADLAFFLDEVKAGDAEAFRAEIRGELIAQLLEQTMLNYMTIKKKVSLYNFTLNEGAEHSTGCNVTSKHFRQSENVLYDQNKRLTYLHYMGIKNSRFFRLSRLYEKPIPWKQLAAKLCDKLLNWEISNIPYGDLFVHYRFMNR